MGWENIFYNETNYVSIDMENIHMVNEEFSTYIYIPRIIAAILILLLAVAALYKVCSTKMTFINALIILDCLNAVAQIPTLLQILQYA